MKQACTALSVWNVVKDHLAFRSQPCCFPKASAKVGLFSELQNFYRRNFQKSGEKIYHTVKNCAIMTNIIQFYKNSLSFSLAGKIQILKKKSRLEPESIAFARLK